MKKITFLLCCLTTLLANAQIPKFESVKLIGEGHSLESRATDASGNVYKTGGLYGKSSFGSKGEHFLTGGSDRSPDIFISKVNSNGDFVWAKKVGGAGYDLGESIALDKAANVYITGHFAGTKDFDPGDGEFNLTGDITKSSVFILKLDASGNFLWAKKIGENEIVYGHSITLDASGNIYTTGTFSETVDFDLGEGVNKLTSTEIDGYSKKDMFILKMDASGNFVWARNCYAGVSEQDHSIAVDASGNVYTTGYLFGKTDLNPGKEKFYLTSKGKKDIFISKLDASGNFVWAKIIGGELDDEGCSIATDVAGNIYITGYFSGTVDFDPGKGKVEFEAPGGQREDDSRDAFICKFNADGLFTWALQIGVFGSDTGDDISIDANNNILIEGQFDGNVDFDPGQGTFFLNAGYHSDSFLLKLSQK